MESSSLGSQLTTRESFDPVLEQLSIERCWRLLRCERLGRVGFIESGIPVILPVHYRVDGETIVFTSAAGSKLSTATRHAEVAFEVDDHQDTSMTGWSVVVKGTARIVASTTDNATLDRLPLPPVRVDREADHWVRITPRSISGRRLSRRGAQQT